MVTSQFVNEHGRTIIISVELGQQRALCRFSIVGPDSMVESVVTRVELEKLHQALGEALRTDDYRAPHLFRPDYPATPPTVAYRVCTGIQCEHYHRLRETGVCCGKNTEPLPTGVVYLPPTLPAVDRQSTDEKGRVD